jgi:hypothetical protein
MHLISEKKLIYAVLALTVVFFVALIALPSLTQHNTFGIHEVEHPPATAPGTGHQ